MNILGLHFGNNAGVCLYQNGALVAAINEERLSRVKNQSGIPLRAIDYILSQARLDKKDIDILAMSMSFKQWRFLELLALFKPRWSSLVIRESQLFKWYCILTAYTYPSKCLSFLKIFFVVDRFLSRMILKQSFKKMGFTHCRLETVDEFHAFAALAYFHSPFKEAIVFSFSDPNLKHSGLVSIGRGVDLCPIHSVSNVASFADLLAVILETLGYIPYRDEKRFLKLAQKGDPTKLYDIIAKLIIFHSDRLQYELGIPNRLTKREAFFLFLRGKGAIEISRCLWRQAIQTVLANRSEEDIAAAIQQFIQDQLISFIEAFKHQFPECALLPCCFSGSLFIDPRLNKALVDHFGAEKVFIAPHPGSGGLALGVATYVNSKYFLELPRYALSVNTFSSFEDKDIEAYLSHTALSIHWKKKQDIKDSMIEALIKDKMIGNFQGGMQYAPRSFGERSLLCRVTKMHSLSNKTRKNDFLALVVLEEYASQYFRLEEKKVHHHLMNVSYGTTEKFQTSYPLLPTDALFELLILNQKTNPFLYQLLSAYYQRTHEAVLVNASLNNHDELIACQIKDGLRLLAQLKFDGLAIGNFWVEALHAQ